MFYDLALKQRSIKTVVFDFVVKLNLKGKSSRLKWAVNVRNETVDYFYISLLAEALYYVTIKCCFVSLFPRNECLKFKSRDNYYGQFQNNVPEFLIKYLN